MKMQRDVSVNGDKERTAKGSQLTRVVPPSFSVPFICDGESKVRCFFVVTITVIRYASYKQRSFWQMKKEAGRTDNSVGQGSCRKRKGEEKHGKGKTGKEYHVP